MLQSQKAVEKWGVERQAMEARLQRLREQNEALVKEVGHYFFLVIFQLAVSYAVSVYAFSRPLLCAPNLVQR